jgi:hypothetical protein
MNVSGATGKARILQVPGPIKPFKAIAEAMTSFPSATPPSPAARSRLFLPLTGESPTAISTRGQHLPSLLTPRRSSTIRSKERGGSTSDEEEDPMPFDMVLLERRISNPASILNTPQMRSQRLIGNSNPRYKWEKYYKDVEELRSMKKNV